MGVSAELLRAWERRYRLLTPSRTAGGLRLYGERDERRVMRMREHLAAGVSAAEAARLTLSELRDDDPFPPTPSPSAEPPGDALARALDQLDEPGAHAALDRLLSGFT
ncbi:MAG: MerR family transcriptional regulator, partial [Verrucomicrobiota bacterium]